MKYFILISFISIIYSLPYNQITINSDTECLINDNVNHIDNKQYALLVKFSPKIAYENKTCSVYVTNPWLSHMQNGFGLFLNQKMDCSAIVTIDCLENGTVSDEIKQSPMQFTCHTSQSNIEMRCNSINITLQRNEKIKDKKKTVSIQVVALAKGELCSNNDLFFQCRNDYPNSCIDMNLKCNGRSECPSGDDEYGCHSKPSGGIPIIVIILLILAFICFSCILVSILICCFCRMACIEIIRRIRPEAKKKSTQKGDVTVVGEDDILIKGLTESKNVQETPIRHENEQGALVIDSTKPIYPRLE